MCRAQLPRRGCGPAAAAAAAGRCSAPQTPRLLLPLLLLAATSALLAVPAAAADAELGCYEDIYNPPNPRLFTNFLGWGGTMTPAVCRQLAVSAGLPVYGVQYGESGAAQTREQGIGDIQHA